MLRSYARRARSETKPAAFNFCTRFFAASSRPGQDLTLNFCTKHGLVIGARNRQPIGRAHHRSIIGVICEDVGTVCVSRVVDQQQIFRNIHLILCERREDKRDCLVGTCGDHLDRSSAKRCRGVRFPVGVVASSQHGTIIF